jgi:hypothetical protein
MNSGKRSHSISRHSVQLTESARLAGDTEKVSATPERARILASQEALSGRLRKGDFAKFWPFRAPRLRSEVDQKAENSAFMLMALEKGFEL